MYNRIGSSFGRGFDVKKKTMMQSSLERRKRNKKNGWQKKKKNGMNWSNKEKQRRNLRTIPALW
jgi:hypothetical protein